MARVQQISASALNLAASRSAKYMGTESRGARLSPGAAKPLLLAAAAGWVVVVVMVAVVLWELQAACQLRPESQRNYPLSAGLKGVTASLQVYIWHARTRILGASVCE